MTSSMTNITTHTLTTGEHTTHYLACGPEDGPLVIFVHGWPELSHSWRHQLPVLASLGFRAVAPDLRGYGNSSVYSRHEDYAQELVVGDMLNLLAGLGRQRAIWVGHDWGSPTVWNIASHHPQQCQGVASLCVPYFNLERGLEHTISLVDRTVYPADQYPAGQWDYQLYYQESFDQATSTFEADPYNTAKILFRKGDPAGFGKPSTRFPHGSGRGHRRGSRHLLGIPDSQRLLRTGFLLHESRRECRLCGSFGQRWAAGNAGTVSGCPVRLRVRNHHLTGSGTHAPIVFATGREGRLFGSLDGPGTAGGRECGAGPLAGQQVPERVANLQKIGFQDKGLRGAHRNRETSTYGTLPARTQQ
jgi:pimeloyl-ACP methyl ester carboxylesterase